MHETPSHRSDQRSANPTRSPHDTLTCASLQTDRLKIYDAPANSPAQLAAQAAQLNALRGEAERLRAERDRLLDRQRQIADLLRSRDADKIVHDLRNVLNELQLYKLLADTQA